MNWIDELEKLDALHKSGGLSDEEFIQAKDALLAQQQSEIHRANRPIEISSSEESTWALLLHLSQYCGYMLPVLGWIVPLTIWLVKKNDSRMIDLHGRIVLNWLLTELIYLIIFGMLCIVLIGIPFVIILGILGFIYPIVGAVKASAGEAWNYPGSIHFLSLDGFQGLNRR